MYFFLGKIYHCIRPVKEVILEKEYKNEYAVIAIYTMYSCTERGRKIPEDDAYSTINICSVSSPKYN